MPDLEETSPNGIAVKEIVNAPELGLTLEVVCGGEGMAKTIRSARIQKLGLALAGYTDYIHPDRVQLLGGSEINYLKILDPTHCKKAVGDLGRLGIRCILITKGLPVPEGIVDLARECGIALLRTPVLSSVAIGRITEYLETRLADHTTIHGVFLEVFNLGILIIGPSGIGKSECALELVMRGHRLVADDSVEIKRFGVDRLKGAGGPILRHHMELRGLGIINIRELFGISATGNSHTLDFVVRLERWEPDREYDRLGLDRASMEIMGIPVPLITMPVAPGRNVSTLVEVAARTQLLRRRGLHLSQDLRTGEVSVPDGGPADG